MIFNINLNNRWFIILISTIVALNLYSQNNLNRVFPQAPPPENFFYLNCETNEPVKTKDGGYIFSFLPWSLNLHNAFPVDYYTIKTDSNFIPQWKKPFYSKAIVLPTGGIILIYDSMPTNNNVARMYIEKITQSGAQVWSKTYTNENIVLNDGINYGNKIRFTGRKRGNTGYPFYNETSQAYTMLMDTMGNFISQSLFNASHNGYVDFSKVKRDPQGNFYVYSVYDPFSISKLAIAKFDSSFNFVWAKVSSSSASPLYLNDIDFLPSGRIFATGVTEGNSIYNGSYSTSALLKISEQGNLISQSYFNGRYKISALCKKNNGNYIISQRSGTHISNFKDSLFIFETDTSATISWYKLFGRGFATGASIIRRNVLFTPKFANLNPSIISSDSIGNSCMSQTVPYNQNNGSIQLINFTLSPISSAAALVQSTLNVLYSQSYIDSCRCGASVSVFSQSSCLPNGTATISATGVGNILWYATPTGTTVLSSGPQLIFSSATATTATFYAQDSSCAINPLRAQAVVNIYASPTLSFNPVNPSICAGNSIFMYAQGASNYTWTSSANPNFNVNSYVIMQTPQATTIFTVTGLDAIGCSDTKTVSLTVVPFPTLTIGPPVSACQGSSAVISAVGASSYSWSNGTTGSSSTVSAVFPFSTYTVTGFNGSCAASTVQTVYALQNPIVFAISSSTQVCLGSSVNLTASGANTYTWTNFSNTNPLAIAPTSSGIFTVTGADLNNCISTATIGINVIQNPSVTIIASNSQVCLGTAVSFSAIGANTYSWSNGTISNVINIIPTANTNYYVTGTDTNNCVNTSSSAIVVNPNPTVAIIPPNHSVCVGNTLNIIAFGGLTYTWSTGSTMNQLNLNPTSNTIITLAASDLNGCTGTTSTAINVNALPVINIMSSDSLICLGESVTLTAFGGIIYSWNTNSNGSNIIISPTANTTFTVFGTDQNGCSSSTSFLQMVSLCTDIISETNTHEKISIFPNPNNGSFNIQANYLGQPIYFELYNSIGQLMMKQQLLDNTTTVNMQNLSNGIYHLSILGGLKPINFKLVKE